MKYISRTIDKTFEEWKESTIHKPLLLCGARQVGNHLPCGHLPPLCPLATHLMQYTFSCLSPIEIADFRAKSHFFSRFSPKDCNY